MAIYVDDTIPMTLGHLGRRPIYTARPVATSEDVKEVLRRSMTRHMENRPDIKYLLRYERGYQDILRRRQDVPTKANHLIVENTASEITDFKVGYVFGNRISLVQRALSDDIGERDPEQDSKSVAALNQMFDELGKMSLDHKLARDFCITGVGYRLVIPTEVTDDCAAPFRVHVLDPRNTFVVESAGVDHEPVMGVTYWVDHDGNVPEYHYTVYTRDSVYEGKGDVFGFTEDPTVSDNGIGMIPIVAYFNSHDRMGCFERVIPLLDAANLASSDRLNDVTQHVQSLLWLHNAQMPEGWREAIKANGILNTSSADGISDTKMQYLTSDLDQSGLQILSDHYYDRALQIAGVPGREALSGGSDTGSAVKLRNGWQIAETAAEASELIFCESERRFLEVVLKIVNTTTEHDIRLGDLDIKFARNQTDNLLTRVQAMGEMLNAGVHPLHVLKLVALFPDPQQVYNDSDFSQIQAEETAPLVEENPQDSGLIGRDRSASSGSSYGSSYGYRRTGRRRSGWGR